MDIDMWITLFFVVFVIVAWICLYLRADGFFYNLKSK